MKKINKRNVTVTLNKEDKNINISNNYKDKYINIENVINDDEDYLKLVDNINSFLEIIKLDCIMENESSIIELSNEIKSNLIQYLYNKNQIFDEFYLFLDQLKRRSNAFLKGTDERILLNHILKGFKEIYKIYKDDKHVTDKNAYFDIINYLLQDDINYIYINELLKRNRQLCNLRYKNEEIDEHIVIYLLDLYIENYKMLIKKKESKYINIEYLKRVYFLFTKNPYLRLTLEDKKIIELKLKEFKYYIKNTLVKQKRKNLIIEEIKQMTTNLFYKSYEHYYDNIENISEDNLLYFKTDIINNINSYITGKDFHKAFLIDGKAYNIKKDDKLFYLTMYGLDLHHFLVRNSVIDRYLRKCEFLGELPDKFIFKDFDFKINGKYPVISYQLSFYLNGKFNQLKVSNDIIEISNNYHTLNENEESLNVYDLYCKSIIKNNDGTFSNILYKINDYFEQILNNAYIEFLKNQNLPFIYYGCKLKSNVLKEKYVSDLNGCFNKLSKEQTTEMINIFSNNIDRYHYSILPIENGIYNFHLLNSFSYLGIENIRMLSDLYFNLRIL